MDKFINELKNKKVISKDDVINLKKYIDKKYNKSKNVEKAVVLSNTIHNILYTNLEGIPDSYKSSIKISILKNTFAQNKTSITMYDIFNCCISEENLKINSTPLLVNWVNEHINIHIKEEDLKIYFKNIKKDKKETVYDKSIVNKNTNKCTNPFKPSILKKLKFKKRYFIACSIAFFIILSYPLSRLFNYSIGSNYIFKVYSSSENKTLNGLNNNVYSKFPNSHLPDYMKYKNINEGKLKNLLIKHNSILVKEPYFSTIISTAKEFNLNPLVLFAITGQEQDFVPENTESASKIANNPFNVFHSWQEYNTDIKDSSKIAARTVINLSMDMPKDSDPFLWIGKSYAEDKNWGKGVSSIFKDLNDNCK